ncbi:DUF6283 family protein [Fodinicola feengrottensis]|uniref:DUF6283 family protein n=1 Tax=Fodinicola feengrottensis TaxID=435914 RepID=UPI0024414BC0|nr:DUF6283 family protein [Fodinicola feengrottensis]
MSVTTTYDEPDQRPYQIEPCTTCPWLVDSAVGRFPAEVFRHSARTAYDLNVERFACHSSPGDEIRARAGFLLCGAASNLSIRLHRPSSEEIRCDRDLYASYHDLAVANGVDPDDATLASCRDKNT